MLYQDEQLGINSSKYGIQKNVKIISFYISSKSDPKKNKRISIDTLTYSSKDQLFFRRKCTPIINPQLHEENIKKQKEYDKKRDQGEARKKRDQEESRKMAKQIHDKKRDQIEARKIKMHRLGQLCQPQL